MAFGFPAKHTEEFKPAAGDAASALSAVKKAFAALGWKVKSESATQLTGSASINLMSWGERINVDVAASGALTITSKCAFPLQCVDYGKNKRNVQQLTSNLAK